MSDDTNDARFEDAGDSPLNLGALGPEDLRVISALAQDAIFQATDIRWEPQTRRFALLLGRFRWEDAQRAAHGPERARALLVVRDVLRVASQGVDRGDPDLVLSLLSIEFQEGEDGAGELLLTLAGDGAIRLSVEALDVTLKDVTRPYAAPSGRTPDHGS